MLRNQGKFNAKLPLGRYPFDAQDLVVAFEDSNSDSSDVVFVPDTRPIAYSDDLTLPGWKFESPSLEVLDNRYATDFGDPSAADPSYSRVLLTVPVIRPRGPYTIKLFLPMLLVALTAALALSVHPRYVEGRIGIGITALLTLVALQLTTNSSLPEVDYLLLIDKLYILSYAFVVLTLAVIVRNSWVDATGDITRAARADRLGLAFLTATYFLVAALIATLSLT